MEKQLTKVLIVEGDVQLARVFREHLSSHTTSRFDLEFCQTLGEAKRWLDRVSFDAIALSIDLPDCRGLNTFIELHAQALNIPIVILACCDSESVALEAVRRGAQDYLVKSKVDGKILSRVIRYAIERKRIEITLVETNNALVRTNHELGRSEESLRRAVMELRASHQQLKTAQLQLIQAEKMESVGMLAAGVAHEVKNPLQTILMGLSYLSRNVPVVDENLVLVLTDMRDAVKRADAIVKDLLSLAAARQLDIKAENINETVDRSLCFVNYDLTRSRILVSKELAAGLPRVWVDRQKIEQALINLFMNAIQAMPEGGTLTIRTVLVSTKERASGVNAGGHEEKPSIAIEIQDTGVGIPAERLPRIFEPFFTTKPNGVGTGLGLPVSKQIVDLHGGTIAVHSGPRGGVRVRITLKTENCASYEKEKNSAG